MAIYLKCSEMKGNVTAKGYEGAVELFSFNIGAIRPVTQRHGTNNNRDVGIMTTHELTISKQLDASTQTFLKHLYDGSAIDKIEIHQCATGDSGSPPKCFAKHTYENVMVTNYIESAGAGGSLETYSLCYTKHEKGYIPLDSKLQSRSPSYIGYDLKQATRV